MSEGLAGAWNARVLPALVERACRSRAILEERRRLVPRASGHVLEIGVGSGLNLPLYDPASALDVVAIDPSPALLARARRRAEAAPVRVELRAASAEALPFDAGRFASAVMTYTLCSVGDPAAALSEIRRVLAPGGRLLLVEHGRAPDAGPRRWQARITPLWRRVAGNCHLDRDVRGAVEAAGFAIESLAEAYGDGPRWLSFTYEGVAVRA